MIPLDVHRGHVRVLSSQHYDGLGEQLLARVRNSCPRELEADDMRQPLWLAGLPLCLESAPRGWT